VIGRAIRSFAAFWYDFIVGDDPVVAIGVVAAFALTALLVHRHAPAWWLVPAATAILLAASLVRAARAARAPRSDD
jgi:hypothetical protein